MYSVIHFDYCHDDSSSWSAAKKSFKILKVPYSKITLPHHKPCSSFLPSVPCFMSFHSTNIINTMQI